MDTQIQDLERQLAATNDISVAIKLGMARLQSQPSLIEVVPGIKIV